MVQLSTVIAVLAATSLPTAFATQHTDEAHLDERSLEAQTALGGAPPESVALPFHAIVGAVVPPPPTLKDDAHNVEANLKQFIDKKKGAVKARIGLVKTKATKDVKFAKTTIKQVGHEVKLKIGSDLRKGIHKWKQGVRKGEKGLGRHRKFRKFHGTLGRIHKHKNVDEVDTEVIIIIKQHGKHRGGRGRKHRGGRKHFGHGRKHRGKKHHKSQHPSLIAEEHFKIQETAILVKGPSKMAPPPMDKSKSKSMEHTSMPMEHTSMPMPAAKAPESAAMPSNKMVKTSMSKAMPADPLAGKNDPSLGPFFNMASEPAAAPSGGWAAQEMKAEGSMGKPAAVAASASAAAVVVAPRAAAVPVEKTVHPVAMPW